MASSCSLVQNGAVCAENLCERMLNEVHDVCVEGTGCEDTVCCSVLQCGAVCCSLL